MKLLRIILAVSMMLVGCLWMLQGLNLLPGMAMSGDLKWAILGGLLAMGGMALVVWSGRRPAP